jgi:FMN reductase
VTARRLEVVAAGLSQPSATRLLADRLAATTERHLRALGIEPAIDVIELRDLAQDLANGLLTGFPAPRLQGAIERVVGADGLIAVSPIFSASYSGLFKLFFDVLEPDQLAGMPTLIAATGGTARHSLALEHALRPLFAYLNAAVVPTAVYAAAEDWGQSAVPADRTLTERIERAADELARAIAASPPREVRSVFEGSPPFEELLRSSGGASAAGAPAVPAETPDQR